MTNDPRLFFIPDEQFNQLVNFAIQNGAITSCNCFQEGDTRLCLITTIEIQPSTHEHPQLLKDEIFPLEQAKAYLVGLLRGIPNGRHSATMAFDLNSGWHRVDFGSMDGSEQVTVRDRDNT